MAGVAGLPAAAVVAVPSGAGFTGLFCSATAVPPEIWPCACWTQISEAWAAEIAGLAPLALQHAKRVLNDDGSIEEPSPAQKELFDKAWGSQDVIEAQVARVEKRPPKFQGA